MKTFPPLILLSVLLASCGDEAGDQTKPRAAELQAENRQLARRVSGLERSLKKKDEEIASMDQRYMDLAAKLDEKDAALLRLATASKTLIAATQARDTLIERQSSLVPVSPTAPPPPPDYQPKADPLAGVAFTDATAIKNRALREWPSNLRMQAAEVEWQVEGWRKMNRYDTQAFENIPYKEKQEMVAAARREWPDNFRMQASEFEGQSSAWKTLEEWERTGIPGVPFKDRKPIIDDARKQWGTNYRMVVSSVERAAAK